MSLRLPAKEDSYWQSTTPKVSYPSLEDEVVCDVVIIGGGVAGLTAAYMLKQAGFTVAVVEKHTLASGTTGGTTGKVTSQHGLYYAQLLNKFGESAAKTYANLAQRAVGQIENIINKEGINCDWQLADNFVYSADPKKATTLQQEVAVAATLGLPATYETDLPLPFEVVGAVKFARQAYFHSGKYVQGLAKAVHGSGSYIFEQSQAVSFKTGQPCHVLTRHGRVRAKKIVVATKVPTWPLKGRCTYGLVAYPQTSYIVAGEYAGDLTGMYISPDPQHYSLLPIATAEGKRLLIGGQSHIPGLGKTTRREAKLAAYGAEHFGIKEITHRWRAMDYMAYDGLPIVGKLYPWSSHIYAIGGFKKWGLNLSMVTAIVLTDILAGRHNDAAQLFTPHRLSAPLAAPKALWQALL